MERKPRVQLPDRYSAASVCAVHNFARKHPDAVFVHGRYAETEMTASQWLKWFRGRLHAKINRNDIRRGRWFDAELPRAAERLTRMISGHYVIRETDVPKEYRPRLAHLIARPEDW